MKYIFLASLVFALINATAQTRNERTMLFDDGWMFLHGDDAAASQPGYNDAAWRKIDLPHDWSIEDLPNQNPDSIRGPFLKSSVGAGATGYTVGGIGWYRKKFSAAALAGKQVYVHFDGVYMYSDVWINGHYLGSHPYGYTPFYYYITPYLSANSENVIAVRVSNLGQNSRWYSGSGIYRHVWLTAAGPVHIAPWGLCVTTPTVNSDEATLQVKINLRNTSAKAGNYTVTTYITSPSGRAVAGVEGKFVIKATEDTEIMHKAVVVHPQLWSPETPALYKVKVVIKDGTKRIDSSEVTIGLRSIAFTTNGFMLNGKRTILRGGCVHQDNGPLGAAAFDMAEERKLQILKANGYNAIRTSHNPPSQSFLDICDSLGLLVMDEFFDEWEEPKLFKDTSDYHHFFPAWWQKDVDATMMRDRNHPSIIIWSIGNEIHERADTDGVRIAKELVDEVHRMDPSRPATEAVCWFWDHPGRPWDSTAIAFAPLDVAGYNYRWHDYTTDHKKFPNRIMMGTESYPLEMLENFTATEKLPYVTGDFIWTAIDYMGETGIGHATLQPLSTTGRDSFLKPWPWYNAWCGDIDIIGYKKPQSYYRDIVWRLKPVEMLVHAPIPAGMKEKVSGWGWPDEQHSWTWPGQEGKTMQVRVFSRSATVRLELNGKMVGEKQIPADSITAFFEVPYEPGTLKAIAVDNGSEKGSVTLTTAGTVQQIQLTADYKTIPANRNSLSYITVELTDASKNLVMNSDMPVHFAITGAGEIAGVGNADPADMSSFQQPVKNTYKGRCIVIIRSTGKPGKITVTADAGSLPKQEISIEAK